MIDYFFQDVVQPTLTFKQWLDDTQQKVAPKNTLGKAVNYTLKEHNVSHTANSGATLTIRWALCH